MNRVEFSRKVLKEPDTKLEHYQDGETDSKTPEFLRELPYGALQGGVP